MKRILAISVAALLMVLGVQSRALAVSINFDDPGLVHGSSITTFYPGVTFRGIANPVPIGPGPFPVPTTVPTTVGTAQIWNPGGTAPGESPPNFAVGVLPGQDPGDPGILMTFSTLISSISLTGLDFGDNGGDGEEMTLAAYGADGKLIGSKHFTTQFVPGAIKGSLNFANMKYVSFNYTNTDFGFYGIDDLDFTPVPEPSTWLLMLGGLGLLIGISRKRRA